MKRYIKSMHEYLTKMSMDELDDMSFDIISQRNDATDKNERAYLDEAYQDVIFEIARRRHANR